MKIRAHSYGSANVIGRNVERLRKEKNIKQKDFIARLQLTGLDVNPTSYSKLEGQVRAATDKEVYTIAMVLGTTMEALFDSGFVNSAKAAFDRGEEKNEENEPPECDGGFVICYILILFIPPCFRSGRTGLLFRAVRYRKLRAFQQVWGRKYPQHRLRAVKRQCPAPRF